MRGSLAAIGVTIALACAAPAAAQDPVLDLPIACVPGDTCFIQQFVDHDPGPGAQDFTCGPLSYDGHKGTDIGLPSQAAQAAGVDVLAAAAGTVAGIRNDMPDILQGTPGAPDVGDRECGNGVLIRHPGGWETQYCHMARGSIAVATGQEVTAGTRLGLVGLSGQTEFPHLHLSVRHDGAVVDPFDPDGAITCGAPSDETLWRSLPAMAPGGLLAAGFADALPSYDDIRAGTADRPVGADTPLVAWGFLFGGRQGDTVRITITGPAGEIISHAEPLDRTQAQLFRAAGRRAPAEGWPAGGYTAEIALLRDGAVIDSLTATTRIPR